MTDEELIKQLRYEETRLIAIFDFVLAERDKTTGTAFNVLNQIKHSISGREPVLLPAADRLEALSSELASKEAENKRMRDALEKIAICAKANFGRQNEKLADIEPMARAAMKGGNHD